MDHASSVLSYNEVENLAPQIKKILTPQIKLYF